MKKDSCKCELVLHYPDKQIPENYENKFFEIYTYIENIIDNFIYDTLSKDTKVSKEFFSGSDGTYSVWDLIVQNTYSEEFSNFLDLFTYKIYSCNKRQSTIIGDAYNMEWIKKFVNLYNDEIIELIKDTVLDLTIPTKIFNRIDGLEDKK